MDKVRCPGQDQRYWKPEDIYDVVCPHCGGDIEFWKDEPMLNCPACTKPVRNPKIDLGCAEWCQHSSECLGNLPGDHSSQHSRDQNRDQQ